MQEIFNQFKEQFNGKSLNDILHYAKIHCCNLSLIKDVDEYRNNEFAFVVEWCPNDNYNLNKRIEVECMYSHLTGKAEFTIINEEVKRYNKKVNMNKVEIKNIHGEVIYTYEGENATIKDAVEDAVKKGVNLTRANLEYANLRYANLYHANLEGANLYRASLIRANLEGANIKDANFKGVNLYRANLYGVNLYGANFFNANLSQANLYGTKLENAKTE